MRQILIKRVAVHVLKSYFKPKIVIRDLIIVIYYEDIRTYSNHVLTQQRHNLKKQKEKQTVTKRN